MTIINKKNNSNLIYKAPWSDGGELTSEG